jgi:GNAT superfamily N-acetyltransferase
MPSKFAIRPAVLDDAETIVEFNDRLARESESKELSRDTLRAGVRALLNDRSLGRYFMALDGQQVVGQTMLTYEWSDWRNGQIWWIQSVYVVPEYRRHGVYRALHRHIRDLALADPGIAGLRLYCDTRNQLAQQVYQNVGLQPAGYMVFEEMFPVRR